MSNARHIVGLVLLLLVLPLSTFAQGGAISIISAYQQYKEIPASGINIRVPTVVEVPFDADLIERSGFAVFDTTANRFEPHLFMQSAIPTPFTAQANERMAPGLVDGSTASYAGFDVPGDQIVEARITLSAEKMLTASGLSIVLDDNVALPLTIAIRAKNPGESERVVVAKRSLGATLVRFPKTTAREWMISFTHIQPLRISELRIVEDSPAGSRSLRFLAQPSHGYAIYFNPDRSVTLPTSEAGDLADSREVHRIAAVQTRSNPNYIQGDIDSDGIPDLRDNCAAIANEDQADLDGNGLGDVCQDFDRDGIQNAKDNCPNAPNSSQLDTDGDGIGDPCDGEESRFTERYAWVPWAGIGFAALVIGGLFALTMREKMIRPTDTPEA